MRLVFVEPPAPPPAPLGVPRGMGAAPVAVPESKPAPVPRKTAPKQVADPTPAENARRLRRAEAETEPRRAPPPRPRAPEESAPEVALAPAEAAPGTAQGAVGGEAGGVVGGVTGGVAGGVVGSAGAGPMSVGQVANPPVLVRRISPEYPEEARRKEIEGLVVVEAILDREGRVEPNVQVVRSIPILDEEAVAAVRKWRFRPARDRDGSPVRVILEVPIRFVLR